MYFIFKVCFINRIQIAWRLRREGEDARRMAFWAVIVCGSHTAPLRGQLGAMTFDLLQNARRFPLHSDKPGERCFAQRLYAKFCLTAMIDGLFLSCLFIVPGPLSIKFMTRGFVQAEIDKLKGDKQYTTKFTSQFVREKDAPPPPAKSTRSAKQSAPSTSSSAKRPVIKKRAGKLCWIYQRITQI